MKKDELHKININNNNNNYKPTGPYKNTQTPLHAHIPFQNNMYVSKVHCRSAVRFGRALPGFLITGHHLYGFLM